MLEILYDRSDVKPSNDEMISLAAKLGADVPFFLAGDRAAIARGIGETLTPFEMQLPYSILVVKDPTVYVPTVAAYAGLSLPADTSRTPTSFAHLFKNGVTTDLLREYIRNDFEPSVFAQFPAIAKLKEDLYSHGADFAMMSGSGSAVFALFEDHDTASHAKEIMELSGNLAYLSGR
jgi:4-diphosphocytidyl-2-C-methyl-D-erythritol kinase